MVRRIITLFMCLALFAVPAFAAAQSYPITVDFDCMANGRAHLTGENNTDFNVRVIAYARTAGSLTQANQIDLAPGEAGEMAVVSTVAPEFGWYIVVLRTAAPGGAVWTSIFSEGDCSFGDGYAPPPSEPTVPSPTSTTEPSDPPAPAPTSTPVPNGFNIIAAQRMCADQSFIATWSGANISSLQFSLTNTSDNWTTGWFSADPSSGSIEQAVDHHSYDKMLAVATFDDGTDQTVSLNLGSCNEAPPAADPAPGTSEHADPAPSASGSVTSLPSTGTGSDANALIMMSILALIASALMVAGSFRQRR